MNRGMFKTVSTGKREGSQGLFNLTRNQLLAHKVRYCDHFWSRVVGLLGTREADQDQACWLIPCNGIHTFGMSYPIDAFFLNKENRIVAIFRRLEPNRASPIFPEAHSVVEFASGHEREARVGDKLILGDAL